VTLEAGLVLTSIGYRGRPIAGLPFDSAAAVVPNTAGRVIDPATARPVRGAYVAGWIKRGPSGFIGTNKSCSMQTVATLVDDFNAGLLADPAGSPAALRRLVSERRPEVVDAAGWQAIDAAETARGVAAGRPRLKFTDVTDMITAARDSATVTPWRKITRRAAVAFRSARGK
jgi:ferredoxin--NADP+ reductase